MTAVPKRKLTVAEYYAREEAAEFKSEYYRGETFAMAGASQFHNDAKDNLAFLLQRAVWGGVCRLNVSDQRVMVEATGLRTYPDIVIVCGERATDPENANTITNPTLIAEVLSPSTESYDRGAKFQQYRLMPSLREYVLVSQDEPLVECFTRSETGVWTLPTFRGLSDLLVLHSLRVPVSIPLADVYRGIAFPDAPER